MEGGGHPVKESKADSESHSLYILLVEPRLNIVKKSRRGSVYKKGVFGKMIKHTVDIS